MMVPYVWYGMPVYDELVAMVEYIIINCHLTLIAFVLISNIHHIPQYRTKVYVIYRVVYRVGRGSYGSRL